MKGRILAAAVAVALVAGCSGGTEEPTAPPTTPTVTPTTPEPTVEPTPEPTLGPEEQAERDGFASVQHYYALFDEVRESNYTDERAITELLDFVGAGYRQVLHRYVENAQLQKWGQEGATAVSLLGLQSHEVHETYSQSVIRVCVDSTGVTNLVDGEPAGPPPAPYALDYVVSTGADGDVPRIDDEQFVEGVTC
ncbi:MAG: hypothetical protein Q4G64_06020 [bacterium]|nr:hypothetical protein [bacterium]